MSASERIKQHLKSPEMKAKLFQLNKDISLDILLGKGTSERIRNAKKDAPDNQ